MKNGLKNEDAVLVVAAMAAGLTVETRRVLSDGQGYCDTQWTLAKMPKNERGFGRVRNCDGLPRTWKRGSSRRHPLLLLTTPCDDDTCQVMAVG